MLTFKALGWLLTYPTGDLIAPLPAALRAIAEERLLGLSRIDEIARIANRMACADLIDLQEEYTSTFDRGRGASLHLFEHVHGESRDRGQAMVDLVGLYHASGLEMPTDELPDFLPLFLEYLSVLDLPEAQSSLTDAGPILANLHAALLRRKSPQAPILAALLDLAGVKQSAGETQGACPSETEDIDAEWAEEPVSFGGQAGGACAKAEDMVRRMNASSDQNGVAR